MKDSIYGIEVEPDYVSFAGLAKDDIEVYMNHEGDIRTPSMVLFNMDSTVDVGLIAQDSAELEPKMVVAPIENYNITTNFPYKYENQLFDDKEMHLELIVLVDGSGTAAWKIIL